MRVGLGVCASAGYTVGVCANQGVCAYARCPSGDPIRMDARHQPLITPSASPPLSRSTRAHKRRKIAPSPLSSTPIDFDLHAARQGSSRRVLDFWNQLAGRYSRRLDEDDIVDLRTVSLVKDRGVIRASSTKYDFGFLTTNDTVSDAPEEDLDELDALAEGVIPDQNSTQKVPPLQIMDPADAEDLRLFLEAENRRKAECGEEDDGEGDGDDDDENEGHGDHELVHEDEAEDIIGLSDNDSDLSDEVADDPETYDDYQVPLKGNDRAASTDLESEDELGKWESDEGTKVYKIEPHEPESDSDIEIIQTVISDPSRPSVTSPCVPSKPNQKPPLNIPDLALQPTTQLHTPPQSSSSVLEPTPDDRASELPTFPISSPVNSHPRRPRPIPRKYVEEEQPVASASSSPVKLTVAEAINSAAKGTQSPRKSRLNLEVVVPRLASLKPKRGPIKAVPRTPSPPVLDIQPPPPRANESDSEIEFIEAPPRLTAREKGKAKATSPPTPASELERVQSASSESDDPLCIVPSSSPTKPASPNTTPREKTSLSSSPFRTPSRKPRPARTFSVKGRKRKRAYSSSPEGTVVATEDPQVEAIFQPHDVEAVQPIGLANVEASPSSRISTVGAGVEGIDTPTRPSSGAYSFHPCYPMHKHQINSFAAKDAKIRHQRRHRRSRSHKSATMRSVDQVTESAVEDMAFPAFPTSSEPHTPRRDRSSSRRRHSAKYSPPPPVPAASPIAPAYNPFQDPRAQFIISHAMHQLSCLMSGVAPPTGTQAWMPPPPLPPPHLEEGGGPEPPPFLQYRDGQWVPFTPRHRGRKPHRHLGSSSSVTHSVSHSRSGSRSRSISPAYHSYDPKFSGGTLPPSSPVPSSSSLPSSPQQLRPKSLVRRSKSKGRRVSFRLEDEGGARVEVVEEIVSQTRGSRRSGSASHVEAGGHDGGRRKGKGMAKTRVQDANGVEGDDGEEWGYESAEPVPRRKRRFVRGQTPGPPSRGPSLRPVTPPRNATSGSSRASSRSG